MQIKILNIVNVAKIIEYICTCINILFPGTFNETYNIYVFTIPTYSLITNRVCIYWITDVLSYNKPENITTPYT